MSGPPPPKPWERGGAPGALPAHAEEGQQQGAPVASPSFYAAPPAASPPYGAPAAGAAPYAPAGGYGAGYAGGGYGAGYGSSYGLGGYGGGAAYPAAAYSSPYSGYSAYGSPYGGSPSFGAGSPYYRPGMLGGGFGGPGDPGQLFPDVLGGGLRKLENAMFAFGRVTQLLEMNLETVLRFVGSLAAFGERMHTVSGDVSSLTSSVHRQSIEFGERSLARLRQIRLNRHRLVAGLLCALALALRWRGQARPAVRHRRGARSPAPGNVNGAGGAAAVDQLWSELSR